MMLAAKGLGDALPDGSLELQILEPDDVDRLSLSWRNRFEPEEMKTMLRHFPGRSVWHPPSQEFILVSPWRRREETAILAEVSGVQHVRPMIAGVFEACRRAGAHVVLTAEMHERQRPRFWQSAGMQHLETVIALSLGPLRTRAGKVDSLGFKRVEAGDERALDLLLAIDNRSFPWLWWNNRDEFRAYLGLKDVEVYFVMREDRVVGYVGLTRYLGWGHLDRIAIAPDYQGNGFGREAVDFAIVRGMELGFRSLSLSTQEENWQSRALYRAAGFRHERDNDYRLYGHWLVDNRNLPGPGNGVHLTKGVPSG